MKKSLLVIALLCLAICTSYAQGGGGQARRTPEERAETMTTQLTTALSLTPDQVTKVKEIQLAQAKKSDELRTQAQGDREAMREQMKTLNDATDVKLKAVLTPEQNTLYLDWKKKRDEEMRARRGGGN